MVFRRKDDQIFGMIYKEYAVQVIYLVLVRLREKAAAAALKRFAVCILCAHRRPFMAIRLAVSAAYGKATLVNNVPPP